MPFPTTAHTNNYHAHTDLVNVLIAKGYTPNSALDLTAILFSAVANMLVTTPSNFVYTPTINPGSVAVNTTAEQTFTVTGLDVNDIIVSVSKPTLTAGLGICGWRVSAANTLAITFNNNTAAAIDPPSEVYKVVAVRP